MRAYERLINYVKIMTPSDESSETTPSSACQFDLAKALVEELRALGVADARVDDKGYDAPLYFPGAQRSVLRSDQGVWQVQECHDPFDIRHDRMPPDIPDDNHEHRACGHQCLLWLSRRLGILGVVRISLLLFRDQEKVPLPAYGRAEKINTESRLSRRLFSCRYCEDVRENDIIDKALCICGGKNGSLRY